MARTLTLDELRHLEALLQKAIAERGEYRHTKAPRRVRTYQLEICTLCKSTSYGGGCQCDNDD